VGKLIGRHIDSFYTAGGRGYILLNHHRTDQQLNTKCTSLNHPETNYTSNNGHYLWACWINRKINIFYKNTSNGIWELKQLRPFGLLDTRYPHSASTKNVVMLFYKQNAVDVLISWLILYMWSNGPLPNMRTARMKILCSDRIMTKLSIPKRNSFKLRGKCTNYHSIAWLINKFFFSLSV
jgi:hypothetical protein